MNPMLLREGRWIPKWGSTRRSCVSRGSGCRRNHPAGGRFPSCLRLWLRRIASLQNHDAFEVAGLREEVEGLHRTQGVASGNEALQVTHLRGGIARDVNDGFWPEGEELVEEGVAGALARRIDDDRAIASRPGYAGEEILDAPGEEPAVRDPVRGGVLLRPGDGGLADFEAERFLEAGGRGECEKPAATVGIDKIGSARGGGLLSNVAGEGLEDEGIVLEEIAGQKAESEVTDDLLHHFAGIGVHAAGGGAKEQGGPLLVLTLGGSLVDALALNREGLIEILHGDRTGGDVDGFGARPFGEEPDRELFTESRLLEVRRDFGAVAPGAR